MKKIALILLYTFIILFFISTTIYGGDGGYSYDNGGNSQYYKESNPTSTSSGGGGYGQKGSANAQVNGNFNDLVSNESYDKNAQDELVNRISEDLKNGTFNVDNYKGEDLTKVSYAKSKLDNGEINVDNKAEVQGALQQISDNNTQNYQNEQQGEKDDEKEKKETTIYKYPNRTSAGNSSEQSLDDVINDAGEFVEKTADDDLKYDESKLQAFSKTLFNIALVIGVFVAVIVGGILGIKLMTSSAEGKAEAKTLLVPYVAGCIAVFGAFGIWKLAITILQGI